VLLLHNQVHTEADTKDSFHVNTFQTLVALALDALTIPFTFYGLNSQVSLIIDDTLRLPILSLTISYLTRAAEHRTITISLCNIEPNFDA